MTGSDSLCRADSCADIYDDDDDDEGDTAPVSIVPDLSYGASICVGGTSSGSVERTQGTGESSGASTLGKRSRSASNGHTESTTLPSANKRMTDAAVGAAPDDTATPLRSASAAAAAPSMTACADVYRSVTASTLVGLDASLVVASAGGSVEILEKLVAACDKISKAAKKEAARVKRNVKTCTVCDKRCESVKHCLCLELHVCDDCIADKDLMESVDAGICKECEVLTSTQCCGYTCCGADDGTSGPNDGCGEHVCKKCMQAPKCGRTGAWCFECMEDYVCPDCDQCAGYW